MLKQIIIDEEETRYWIDENGKLLNKQTNKYLKGSIRGGYLFYELRIKTKRKVLAAHRLVAEYFIENLNNLPIVNHKDGNKLNNNVNNLEWATVSENNVHAYNTGLKKKTNGREERIKYNGDYPGEIWMVYKDTTYMISNLGRVLNNKTQNIMKGKVTKDGYKEYCLTINGKKKSYLAHRLVYLTFNKINENSDTLQNKIINHIDGDKLNNKLENLELITQLENVMKANYETKVNSKIKPVYKYDLNGNLLDVYPSCAEAARMNEGCQPNNISNCCNGKLKTHHGYKWSYNKV